MNRTQASHISIMFPLRKTLKPTPIFSTAHRLITTVGVKHPEPPTSAAYDDLICAAGAQRDFATVQHLLSQRYKKGFFTTTNTFNFISSHLSVLGDLLKAISDLNGAHARRKAYESLISRLCKMHLIDEAFRVAEEAVTDDGTRAADASTFHPILSVLTRKKDFTQGWRLLEIMKGKGIARDVTCYNFFITSYSVAGDLRSTVDVLRKIAEEGLTADARTYDALVLGACRVGRLDGAMAVLRRMLDDGVEPLYATYAHVIGSLVRLGYCAQAVKLVLSYGGKDKKLDSHNFGLLATRLIAMKKGYEAEYVLQEMFKRDLDMSENLQQYFNENVK